MEEAARRLPLPFYWLMITVSGDAPELASSLGPSSAQQPPNRSSRSSPGQGQPQVLQEWTSPQEQQEHQPQESPQP